MRFLTGVDMSRMKDWDEVLLLGGPVLCTSAGGVQIRGGNAGQGDVWRSKAAEGVVGEAVRRGLEEACVSDVTPYDRLGQ